MKNKLQNRPQIILDLLEKNLGTHKEVVKAVEKIRENPEIIEALLGELNAAIYSFNRLKNESSIKNAQNLIGILKEFDLPESSVILESLSKRKKSKKLKQLFIEMSKFKFLDKKTSEVNLLSRILVALYRTYLLQNISGLREKGAQVASSLEEMLAVMAIKGFDTHLFQATKHWILDWKREGFSKELAEKIAKL
ncbi:hypothetical protein HZB96_01420 [Candidatus Gottesmanbacteria bacterium]|nr:hypothetical protein [Candidatus Gottesmanbacteria bacterium]